MVRKMDTTEQKYGNTRTKRRKKLTNTKTAKIMNSQKEHTRHEDGLR